MVDRQGLGKHVILQRQFLVPFGFGRRLIGYRGRQKYFVEEIKGKYHDRDAAIAGGAIGRVRHISGLLSMRSRHCDKATKRAKLVYFQSYNVSHSDKEKTYH